MGNEWDFEKVEDIALKVGIGPFGSSIKISTFVPSGIPVISGSHLKRSRLTDAENNFVTVEHADKLKNANVFRGDVVFTHAGTIGQVSYIPEDSKYKRYILSQRQFYLRPNKARVIPEYVTYYFTSPEGQFSLLANASYSGVPSIAQPVSYLRKLLIPVPPLPTQKAIAHILGTLDDKIELLRQMNETLETMARALFKSWFIDFDPVRKKAEGLPTGLLPEIDVLFPDSFRDSELGEIPKGWEIGSIKQYCNAINEQQSPDQFSGTENYVGLEHIPRKSIALLSFGNSEDLESNKAKFIEDDILFGKLRPYFHKVVFAPENGICSTDILVIRPSEREKFSFCLMHLSSEAMVDYATSYSNGTKMPRASWNDIQNYKVAAPPQKLIKYFNNISIYQLKMIKSNIKENKELVKIRDALLPKLISGNLEVKDIDKILEPAS